MIYMYLQMISNYSVYGPIIKTLNIPFVDICGPCILFFYYIQVISSLIEKEWALQSFYPNELNTKHQFTVTRDFVI